MSTYNYAYNTFNAYAGNRNLFSDLEKEAKQSLSKSEHRKSSSNSDYIKTDTQNSFNKTNKDNYNISDNDNKYIYFSENTNDSNNDNINQKANKYIPNHEYIISKITEVDEERYLTERENREEKVQTFSDEYDENYRNIICWNCGTTFAGGYTWTHVTCPKCNQLNICESFKNEKVSEWERILEMQHTKVTCSNCKKNIYCKRESSYVTCDECHCIMSIIKDVPLRPTSLEHKLAGTVLIPEEKDFKSEQIKLHKDNKKTVKFDPYSELINTVKNNEFNINKMKKKY